MEDLKVGDVVVYKADNNIKMVVLKVVENGYCLFSFFNTTSGRFDEVSLPKECVTFLTDLSSVKVTFE